MLKPVNGCAEVMLEGLHWIEGAEQVERNGFFLLEAVYHSERSELLEIADIEILRQVWPQNFYWLDGQVHLRDKEAQPPSAQRICSPYDLDARFSSKREISWTSYKLHLTETCNADGLNLITNVETRSSTEPDHLVTILVHEHLAQQERIPSEHYLDQG